ncbi:unnamed protein product [Sphenostylis stenocarpa]|uniref:Protein kinase domain-containing protein n=1 Tax=Sphenostylis stenocarpa TaxID=92480 RepID=A0AA86SB19_9FABA|nr:unnamed protein product [Sphenostylis stenocarpa]
MSNGSLSQHLQRGGLSWKKRLEICIGAARGLHYLHAGAKRTIIHCDFGVRSILLNDDMEPKIADFIFCRQGAPSMSKPKTIKVNCIWGTSGKIAWEYAMYGTITDKCDVYSFGTVLLEVACGGTYHWTVEPEKPVEDSIDPNIKRNIAPACWKVFVDIIDRCVMYEPHERPTMGEVEYPAVIQELCHQFSLTDLRKSTDKFDRNRLIGYASFGKVYKGCLQHNDGSDYTVAVKRLNAEDIQEHNQFNKEIELLCGDTETLSWKKRIEICIGVARGLHYLHAGAKRTIIHRHICLANILLDDNMEPKLAGFGRSIQGARFMSKPKEIPIDDDVRGTYGYLPMENFRDSTVTDKCDVFSFGMVLLEVVCGRNYFDMAPIEGYLEKPVEENIDLNIKGKIVSECWEVFIDITRRCVKYEAEERPTMGEVEVQLEHALLLQEQADITNIHGDEYTLLSKTIIKLKPEREDEQEHGLSLRQEEEEDISNTEDSDLEDMFHRFGLYLAMNTRIRSKTFGVDTCHLEEPFEDWTRAINLRT